MHLNPYLNFHRPCGFATLGLDARGKRESVSRAARKRWCWRLDNGLDGIHITGILQVITTGQRVGIAGYRKTGWPSGLCLNNSAESTALTDRVLAVDNLHRIGVYLLKYW